VHSYGDENGESQAVAVQLPEANRYYEVDVSMSRLSQQHVAKENEHRCRVGSHSC
jgi:hypothetical protein